MPDPDRKRAVVLGCGLVGATIARDLAADERLDVAVADASQNSLGRIAGHPHLRAIQADLSDTKRLRDVIADCDVVVGAMPSIFGLATLRTVIEAGKPYSDISFMPEDATSLDALARERGVTAVVDCGVAPGLANLIIGHCHAALDKTTDVTFYVGGLPKRRSWPYQYQAPFAPSDVIEEYTRPARFVQDGRVVVRPALSDAELIEFEPVGTLEAFNTDGLRSLLKTIQCANMREKTLRYPGHIELMRVLRETGFFDKQPIDVRGQQIRPLDLTSRLLFPKWELKPGDAEFTILRVLVTGRRGKETITYEYDLYDEYDPATGQHSMARTTGFPCAIVARWLAFGELVQPGVNPPELLAAGGATLPKMIAALAERGVHIRHCVNTTPAQA